MVFNVFIRLPSGGSITEIDENEDVQTLTLDPPEKTRQKLFKTPKIRPLAQSPSSEHEIEKSIEDNWKNEKKVKEINTDTSETIYKITKQLDELYDKGIYHKFDYYFLQIVNATKYAVLPRITFYFLVAKILLEMYLNNMSGLISTFSNHCICMLYIM